MMQGRTKMCWGLGIFILASVLFLNHNRTSQTPNGVIDWDSTNGSGGTQILPRGTGHSVALPPSVEVSKNAPSTYSTIREAVPSVEKTKSTPPRELPQASNPGSTITPTHVSPQQMIYSPPPTTPIITAPPPRMSNSSNPPSAEPEKISNPVATPKPQLVENPVRLEQPNYSGEDPTPSASRPRRATKAPPTGTSTPRGGGADNSANGTPNIYKMPGPDYNPSANDPSTGAGGNSSTPRFRTTVNPNSSYSPIAPDPLFAEGEKITGNWSDSLSKETGYRIQNWSIDPKSKNISFTLINVQREPPYLIAEAVARGIRNVAQGNYHVTCGDPSKESGNYAYKCTAKSRR